MSARRWLTALIFVGICVASACGGSSPSMPTGAEPRISGLTPSPIVEGQAPIMHAFWRDADAIQRATVTRRF